MARISKLEDFRIGRIMYHIYGINRTETKVAPEEITKYIVTSKPYPSNVTGILNVDVICEYQSDGETRSFSTTICPSDSAIFQEKGRKAHNLNRLFNDKESAMKFLQELKDNKFSDPVDIEYSERMTPEKHKEEREFMWGWEYEDEYYSDEDFE